jgi:6-pyruvoyltetrahydropterin/6-carboxytetrahydropterin synthase
MIIRKLFKFEGAHIVRNCSSIRCKKSIHGHSYVVEVFFSSDGLDNGQMVMDFGLMKGNIKDLIDSFDHAYSMWDKESDEFKKFMVENSERYITMPVSPSAEAYALMFLMLVDKVVKATEFNNGEVNVEVTSVKVHETVTGYAEAFIDDLDPSKFKHEPFKLEDIKFSQGIMDEWKDPDMYNKLIEADENGTKCFINEAVEQQV